MHAELWVGVGVTACLALSFLFSGMEAGVFALSRLRIRRLSRGGSKSARTLLHYLELPERFLWTILIGNTVANFLIVAWAADWLFRTFTANPALRVGFFLGFVFLFYVACDLLPKIIFRAAPNRLCLAVARPFRAVDVALKPLVRVLTWCSHGLLRWTGGRMFTGRLFGNREEFRRVMQESALNLTTEEHAMINRVLDLQGITVRHLTVPMAKVVTLTPSTTVAQLQALSRERRIMRFPVWQRDAEPRSVGGIVDLRRLLYQPNLDPAEPVQRHLTPALFLEDHLALETALQRMRRGGQPLAIVLNAERRELGIITLEDILGFIFGEVKL